MNRRLLISIIIIIIIITIITVIMIITKPLKTTLPPTTFPPTTLPPNAPFSQFKWQTGAFKKGISNTYWNTLPYHVHTGIDYAPMCKQNIEDYNYSNNPGEWWYYFDNNDYHNIGDGINGFFKKNGQEYFNITGFVVYEKWMGGAGTQSPPLSYLNKEYLRDQPWAFQDSEKNCLYLKGRRRSGDNPETPDPGMWKMVCSACAVQKYAHKVIKPKVESVGETFMQVPALAYWGGSVIQESFWDILCVAIGKGLAQLIDSVNWDITPNNGGVATRCAYSPRYGLIWDVNKILEWTNFYENWVIGWGIDKINPTLNDNEYTPNVVPCNEGEEPETGPIISGLFSDGQPYGIQKGHFEQEVQVGDYKYIYGLKEEQLLIYAYWQFKNPDKVILYNNSAVYFSEDGTIDGITGLALAGNMVETLASGQHYGYGPPECQQFCNDNDKSNNNTEYRGNKNIWDYSDTFYPVLLQIWRSAAYGGLQQESSTTKGDSNYFEVCLFLIPAQRHSYFGAYQGWCIQNPRLYIGYSAESAEKVSTSIKPLYINQEDPNRGCCNSSNSCPVTLWDYITKMNMGEPIDKQAEIWVGNNDTEFFNHLFFKRRFENLTIFLHLRPGKLAEDTLSLTKEGNRSLIVFNNENKEENLNPSECQDYANQLGMDFGTASSGPSCHIYCVGNEDSCYQDVLNGISHNKAKVYTVDGGNAHDKKIPLCKNEGGYKMGMSGENCETNIIKDGDYENMTDNEILEFFNNYCSLNNSTPKSFNQLYEFCKTTFLSVNINEHIDQYMEREFPYSISDAYGVLLLNVEKLRGSGISNEEIEHVIFGILLLENYFL